MQKRNASLLAVAILAIVILIIAQFTGQSAETGAWGLSFQQENEPPVGPASSEELSRFDAAYLGNTQEKIIYLTFDAGYENGCTARILDTLKKAQCSCRFFSGR